MIYLCLVMWRKRTEWTIRLQALLLLTIMVWLGGALVAHTLSHHHLHEHLHSDADATGGEQCMLLVFVSTPFSIVSTPDVPDAACVGGLHFGMVLEDATFTQLSPYPSLRAPPIC